MWDLKIYALEDKHKEMETIRGLNKMQKISLGFLLNRLQISHQFLERQVN